MAAAPRIGLKLVGILLAAAVVALASSASANAQPKLKVGVGRADITPPTGYYMMGWVRSDGRVIGQHTRLWARAIVLKRGHDKVALVSEDLNGIPGGMMATAAERVPGFSERNVLDSASHTHAAPTGFYNFPTFNTVFMSIDSPTDFQLTGVFDPQLYAFEVRQLAKAIRRANSDLAPGKVGWGEVQIRHLTKNRSLEAHLYDQGSTSPMDRGR
jgi:neutral ceramidase